MKRVGQSGRYLLAAVSMVVFSGYVQAADVKVHCHGKGQFTSINSALKALDPSRSNEVTVSGRCHENVLVQSFDHLALIASTGATISDASGGTAAVVDIEDSRRVTLQGFTINGGVDGVICASASVCYLTGNTIQGAVGQEAVAVSLAASAFLTNNVVQNNTLRGMTLNDGSTVGSVGDVFQGNPDTGIVANSDAHLVAVSSTIQNNGSVGILASDRSSVRLISCTITANARDGVVLQHSSSARFDTTNTVTGNGASGVSLGDLSFGLFGPDNTITGNHGGTDVVCNPKFSATRGALVNIGGGTTNCKEPE
jgi:Right handed beta helix region